MKVNWKACTVIIRKALTLNKRPLRTLNNFSSVLPPKSASLPHKSAPLRISSGVESDVEEEDVITVDCDDEEEIDIVVVKLNFDCIGFSLSIRFCSVSICCLVAQQPVQSNMKRTSYKNIGRPYSSSSSYSCSSSSSTLIKL